MGASAEKPRSVRWPAAVVASVAVLLAALVGVADAAAVQAVTIDGTVTDDTDASPIQGLAIDLFTQNPDGSRGTWLQATTTNPDGTYTFAPDPGCYVLTFIAPTNRTFTDSNSPFLDSPVCLTDGETTTINAALAADDLNTAPTITSPDTASIPENTTAVVDIEATDDNDAENGAGLSYAITGGDDGDLFGVDVDSGVLAFLAAPDFENPGDVDGDNLYLVEVTVTDSGGLTGTVLLMVTVTDIDDDDPPPATWATGLGDTGNDVTTGVTTDAAGNVYVTGAFQGTIDFDPGAGSFPLTSRGGQDVFVAKYDPAGDLIWAVKVGGTGSDRGSAIAIDPAGNVTVTGTFQRTVDFDPTPGSNELVSNGSRDVFVLELSTDAEFRWARSFGNAVLDQANALAIDSAGDSYLTGRFSDTVDFDPGAGVAERTAVDAADFFLLKLDGDGDFVWVGSVGSTGFDQGNGLAIDPAGNVMITGEFEEAADFAFGPGQVMLNPGLRAAAFVASYDPTGDLRWAVPLKKTVDLFGRSLGTGVAVGPDGDVVATGIYTGAIDFDPGDGTSTLITDGVTFNGYVVKFDNDGLFEWASGYGASGVNDTAAGVVVDDLGRSYATGGFQGTTDFDPGAGSVELTSAGGVDAFVRRLGPNGDLDWVRRFGGTEDDGGIALALDDDGNTINGGGFRTTVDFDPGPGILELTSAGAGDGYVLKLDPLGNLS